MHPEITSLQNPKIKQALALEKSRERKKQGRFLVEGQRELDLAILSGYQPVSVFFDPAQINSEIICASGVEEDRLLPTHQSVFAKLAYREKTAGVVAVMESRNHLLSNLRLAPNPLILVVESVEKPGNLGALLRTADAANVDAVIVCDPLVDFYNPNVVRSSVGGLFTRQLAACTSIEAIDWLQKQNISIYCTHLKVAQPYHKIDYRGASAIIMGTEATGLSDVWVEHAAQNIIIPMRGVVDSMNVSVAAAVVIFEAIRQRNAADEMASVENLPSLPN